MKRLYFFVALMLLSLTTLSVAQITVKFQKPTTWTAVSLYTWGPEALGGWPGATLTETNGWYTYTFASSFTGANLIFNNAGAGEQTQSFPTTSSVCLITGAKDSGGQYALVTTPCTSGGITVTFQKPAAWAGVNLYAWYDTSSTPPVTVQPVGGWPGAALTAVNGQYSYTFDASITGVNVIFNSNGVQTASAYLTSNSCFSSTGTDLTAIACTTGIADVKEIPLTIYPNPIVDKINFNALENIKRLTIHSLTGETVMLVNQLTKDAVVDVKYLKSGVYFVSIDYVSGKQQTDKFIKL